MEEIIFDDFGCQILLRNGKFFIRYDGGEIAIKIMEHEITEEEATYARQGEKQAYDIILKAQSR